MKTIKRLIPILQWLPNYKGNQFRGDLIAGITVAIVLIPQGIAYALIAGLPSIYGLYCTFRSDDFNSRINSQSSLMVVCTSVPTLYIPKS